MILSAFYFPPSLEICRGYCGHCIFIKFVVFGYFVRSVVVLWTNDMSQRCCVYNLEVISKFWPAVRKSHFLNYTIRVESRGPFAARHVVIKVFLNQSRPTSKTLAIGGTESGETFVEKKKPTRWTIINGRALFPFQRLPARVKLWRM